MIIPVGTENPSKLEPLHMTLAPLGRRSRKEWILSGVSCNGFFMPVSVSTVLRTIVRTHDCGCAEGKRFILTQGGRMREGATPSDKRAIRLIDCCRDRFSGPINKAVALDKGLTPSRTPQRGDV